VAQTVSAKSEQDLTVYWLEPQAEQAMRAFSIEYHVVRR
jgi:hypothetical protein